MKTHMPYFRHITRLLIPLLFFYTASHSQTNEFSTDKCLESLEFEVETQTYYSFLFEDYEKLSLLDKSNIKETWEYQTISYCLTEGDLVKKVSVYPSEERISLKDLSTKLAEIPRQSFYWNIGQSVIVEDGETIYKSKDDENTIKWKESLRKQFEEEGIFSGGFNYEDNVLKNISRIKNQSYEVVSQNDSEVVFYDKERGKEQILDVIQNRIERIRRDSLNRVMTKNISGFNQFSDGEFLPVYTKHTENISFDSEGDRPILKRITLFRFLNYHRDGKSLTPLHLTKEISDKGISYHDDEHKRQLIKISQNPVADELLIENIDAPDRSNVSTEIEIYDSRGTLIYRNSLSESRVSVSIDLSTQISGIYYIKAISDNQIIINA